MCSLFIIPSLSPFPYRCADDLPPAEEEAAPENSAPEAAGPEADGEPEADKETEPAAEVRSGNACVV